MDGLDPGHGGLLRRHRVAAGGHDGLGAAFALRRAQGLSAIATTRGDRLFIGLLGSAYLHLLVVGATDWSTWIASALSVVWLLVVMRWG